MCRVEMHANGNVYEGEVSRGMRHGVGSMYLKADSEVDWLRVSTYVAWTRA
jgi:hypothetical protein